MHAWCFPFTASARCRLARALVFSLFVHVALIWSFSPRIGTQQVQSWDEPRRGSRILQATLQYHTTNTPTENPGEMAPPEPASEPNTPEISKQSPPPLAAATIQEQSPTQGEYVLASKLSQPPELLDMGTLDRPGLVKPDENGRLVIEILINEMGRVDGVLVLESTMQPLYLDNAIRAFQRGIFKPGKELNRPVRSRLKIEVVLHSGLSNIPPAASGVSPLKSEYLPSDQGDH